MSALFLAFFVLNKQAFANYYFFVIGALCVAVAATQQPAASRPAPSRGPRADAPRTDDDRRPRAEAGPGAGAA